jgi:hypothetical protein
MPNYRIYLLNNSGHILGPHHLVTCDTDQEIIGKAKSLMEGDDVEIWDWRVAKILIILPVRGFPPPARCNCYLCAS